MRDECRRNGEQSAECSDSADNRLRDANFRDSTRILVRVRAVGSNSVRAQIGLNGRPFLFPVPCSLFPAPCSLLPRLHFNISTRNHPFSPAISAATNHASPLSHGPFTNSPIFFPLPVNRS